MQSPNLFIVKPRENKRYNNTKNIGGIDFITSTSQEDHQFSNRYAIVVSTPLDYDGDIAPGDTLLVHHNVFKYYYDMKGKQKSGKSFLNEGHFMVDREQFFMYKKNGEWRAHGKFCFIEPIQTKESVIYKNTREEPLVGKIRYINDELLSLGLKVGDEVGFQPESEYAFDVEGEKLYRMFTNNICLRM